MSSSAISVLVNESLTTPHHVSRETRDEVIAIFDRRRASI
jgi:hypothetical protein